MSIIDYTKIDYTDVSHDTYVVNDWFKTQIAEDTWHDVRNIQITDERLFDSMDEFLSSESVAHALEHLDLENLYSLAESSIAALANNTAMSQLNTLRCGRLSSRMLELLLDSPNLASLQHLSCSVTEISDEAVTSLAETAEKWTHLELRNVCNSEALAPLFASPNFTSLQVLSLAGNELDGQTALLANAPFLPSLKRLDLSDCGLTAKEIAEVFSTRASYMLEELDVSSSDWEDELVAEHWSTLQPLEKLEKLHLGNTDLSDESLEAVIAHATAYPNLEELDLSENFITSKGVAALARTESLKKLRALVLWFNTEIGDEGARLLAGAEHLTQLTTIDIQDCSLSYLGANALKHAAGFELSEDSKFGELVPPPNTERLTGIDRVLFMLESGTLDHSDTLEISELSGLGDDAAKIIAMHPNAKKIKTLKIIDCDLTRAGLEALLDPENRLESMTTLCTPNNNLTDEDLIPLAEDGLLRGLEELDLSENCLSFDGAWTVFVRGGGWSYVSFEGNEAPEGKRDVYGLIDEFHDTEYADQIDVVEESG